MIDADRINRAEKVLGQEIFLRGNNLTSSDILEIINEYQPVFKLSSDEVDHIKKVLEARYVTTMGVGVSLIDEEISHDEEWYQKHEIKWNYWDDYKNLLLNDGWPTRVISSMDAVTDKILGLLHYPLKEGDWERRGLVIGHVQSGKTANYIGLIAKAADAGYKFIIVIAGIHNNLRTQTQERIDQGFIGRDSTTHKHIGVGNIRPKRDMPLTVTTTESDFNKSLAKRFGMELKSLNNTFILVIKKNASTLSSLYNWLKELNTREKLEKIVDIPMLLIDDEADNASINTNKPDLDPTRINRDIRNILNLFRKRCYVGYTATPFANIFINPDDRNETLGKDLFPEDFIHCLDAPTNYFGSEKIFLDDDLSKTFIRTIDDSEDWLPLTHKKIDSVPGLPPSLKRAIRTFILSRAIRNLRGQKNQHCSMMINVSRFVAVQRELKELIKLYIEQLKNSVRFNYKLSLHKALENESVSQLYLDFVEEYLEAGVTWEDVLAELDNAANGIKIFLVNSKSDDALDYTTYSKEGNALTAITIGGLSLSRGLTIEGLTVSYIYRNTKMYDTLLQMGRWFGYRDKYEDLCRIYMSETSYAWYSHIAEATEELRTQIKRMRRAGKKPIDFGLYVRAHPDALIVTALNKMRNAANMAFNVSYDGKLLETHIIPEFERKTSDNRVLFQNLFEELTKSNKPLVDQTNSYLFRDLSWSLIQNFMFQFQFHDDLVDLKVSVPEFIKEISDLYPFWDISFKSLAGVNSGEYIMAAQERNIGHDVTGTPRIPPSEKGWYVGDKNKVSGNSMFVIGLDTSQQNQAKVLANDAGRKKPIYSDYTNARGKPFLLLHFLNLVDKDTNGAPEEIATYAPALSICFPNSTELRTIEYVVGPVLLKQLEQDRHDSVDEEDDYDFG